MRAFDPAHLTQAEIYKLMTGAVVPRPIAWVSTLSSAGVHNLAPFSSFTFVCHDPPMLAVGIDAKVGGDGLKDTARNILHRGEFVVHIADRSLLPALHASAEDVPPEVSELEFTGLTARPSRRLATPAVAEAPIAIECVLERCIELGRPPNRLMIGRVVQFLVREALLDGTRIDMDALDPLSRLGGPHYAGLGATVTMPARRSAAPV